MKQRTLIPLVAISIILAISIIPINAAPSTPSKLKHLQGEKIPIFGKKLTLSSKLATYVSHGWTTGGELPPPPKNVIHPLWSEMTGEQKLEYLKTASFRLYITPPKGTTYMVELTRVQWYQQDGDIMSVVFYVEFPSNTFEPGKYQFTGYWQLEYKGVLFSFENTVTVTFT